MDWLIGSICCGLLTAAIVIAAIIGKKRLDKKAATEKQFKSQDPLAEPTTPGINVKDLLLNDLVEYFATTYTVRGVATFNDGGWSWTEFFLETGAGDQKWLEVEVDEGHTKVTLWESSPSDLDPNRNEVAFDGQVYRLDEQSRANYASQGTTGLKTHGTVVYRDFRSGNNRLSFEKFDGAATWETSSGICIDQRDLKIYRTA